MKYEGIKTREISFPIGGIGTGCIGIAGNGRFVDWEIFNRPAKGTTNGFSHFAVKAEAEGKVLDARVLNSDFQHSFTGGETTNVTGNEGFGGGPDRSTMAGMPHFKDLVFEGEFPFATLHFEDEVFPGKIAMTAFNPLIPTNDFDSSIPGAFFEFELHNTTDKVITYTICGSLQNPMPKGTTVNKHNSENGLNYINLSTKKGDIEKTAFGDLTIATDNTDFSYQEYWYRGAWFDNLGIFWREFATVGRFKNRDYDVNAEHTVNDICSLATHLEVMPGEKKTVKFIITWNFPYMKNFWNPKKIDCSVESCCDNAENKIWKNYYATVFENSVTSAIYSLKNWNRLYSETMLYKNAMFSSTLPKEVIDAVSANIAVLKSPTCLRLEDGSFYGFEGCLSTVGSCEGSCTHVWNYAYALPFLFPKLERSMRDLDFKYNQREDGGMSFRLQLPLGRERSGFRPCADGQFGGVIKAYRDWKICGDTEWLKSNWQAIKKSIEFAWASTNEDKWDADMDGVLEGRQHHTLDMELFGPNSWLNGFYLAALKAGAEMAEFLGETNTANQFMNLFDRGRKYTDEKLFNGEYYHQLVDITNPNILQLYSNEDLKGEVFNTYWNDESKEIKYQIAGGCLIDQVIAQWHANICGLGEIFDKVQTQKALESIYKNNFKKNMRGFFNPCRLYNLNDEGGVIICDWPDGQYKPLVPLTYAEETMNGFEYQAAVHMIQEGLVEEGMEIIRSIRGRYDGEHRNPWNEFECGSNYARSMASYSLLNTFSGFEFNMAEGMLGFNPITAGNFNCFWSLDSGWGTFETIPNGYKINVLYGKLMVKKLRLPLNPKRIEIDEKIIGFNCLDGSIIMDRTIEIKKGEALKILCFM